MIILAHRVNVHIIKKIIVLYVLDNLKKLICHFWGSLFQYTPQAPQDIPLHSNVYQPRISKPDEVDLTVGGICW